jgi:hypothetical protein
MSPKTTIDDCHIIELGKIHNRAGNITVVDEKISLPFKTKRIFYLFDIPGGESRGAHAHLQCHQFIVAASGAFEIALDDGINQKTIMLNRPYFGLHIPPGIWAHELNFSSGAICLVFTSELFDENDYIRDYTKYLNFRNDPSFC